MALVAFIRGINVGGRRRFRPSTVAEDLRRFDVVNVGAAGTFIVRKPGSRATFVRALRQQLPFPAEIAVCSGSALVRLEENPPFDTAPSGPDVVRFVSVLAGPARRRPSVPLNIPASREWYVRVIAKTDRFVIGTYRRHMRTIGYLGQLDTVFGAPATTRSWSTVVAIARILRAESQ
jgi:uncharacterized protein (DUF1697 family)